MKKKKKKSFKKKNQKSKKHPSRRLKNKRGKLINKKFKFKKRKKVIKKPRRKFKIKVKKIIKIKSKKKSNRKTRAIVSSFLRFNDKIKSLVRFNFNLDQFLQNFFNGILNKFSVIKKVIIEEREKQKLLKIKQMENEKKEAQRKLIQEGEIALKTKKTELKEEQKLERERKIDLQKFIRSEQAELRKERAEKQRNFLEQIRLEKKIDQFRTREELEIKSLEKYVLSHQRESYEEVQQRI
ncbi:MAG: hypothetical protein ACJZ8N_01430, partial [Candidatus Pelagibacter sp.]